MQTEISSLTGEKKGTIVARFYKAQNLLLYHNLITVEKKVIKRNIPHPTLAMRICLTTRGEEYIKKFGEFN